MATKLFRWMKDLPPAEEALHAEMLKSERSRVAVLAAVAGLVGVLGLAVVAFVPPERNPLLRLSDGTFPLGTLVGLALATCAYELGLFFVIGVAIRKDVRPPEVIRFGNALVEASLPTIFLAVVAHFVGGVFAVTSPIVLAYFLFIILSTLRLRFALGLFTGAVAAIGYFTVCWVALRGVAPDAQLPFASALAPCAGRAALLLAGGLMAGFVGAQIRKRVLSSLAVVEERNRIAGLFGQHVSPAVVDRLLRDGAEPGSEVRSVSVLFLDIRGFTRFAEKRSPQEVVDYLNKLFGPLVGVVDEHGGIINKFLGDGFMAVFGAPLSDGQDVQRAVRAGVAIAHKVEELNLQHAIPETRVGLGLHTGAAVTGNVGSERRKEYTIIGDTVNLAARVEQLNKEYQSTFLVTETVYDVVKAEHPGQELPAVNVKGRDESVKVYRLL